VGASTAVRRTWSRAVASGVTAAIVGAIGLVAAQPASAQVPVATANFNGFASGTAIHTGVLSSGATTLATMAALHQPVRRRSPRQVLATRALSYAACPDHRCGIALALVDPGPSAPSLGGLRRASDPETEEGVRHSHDPLPGAKRAREQSSWISI